MRSDVTARWLRKGLLVVAVAAAGTWAAGKIEQQRRTGELELARSAAGADELSPGPAIPFELPVRGGGTLHLGQLKGKVVLVTFWASWCPPCRAEEPSLRKLARRFSRDSFAVVAISVDDDWATVEEFFAGVRPPYTVALDRGALVSRSWGTTSFPESYVVDANGNLRLKFVGPRDWTALHTLRLLQGMGAQGL